MKLKKISTIISLSLIVTCSAAMAAGNPPAPNPAPKAVDTKNDQGHGTVTFKGSIIEAPCSIAPDSVDQTVQLGQVSTAQLKANGSSSPRLFDIKLEGCDVTTKKTVTTAFSGNSKGDNLALMGGTAAGASIVIDDASGKAIKLNGPASAAMPLQAGVTTLHYSAFLKPDSADGAGLRTGDFTSVATFALNYP